MHVFPQYAILCHAITTILDFQIHVKFANLDSKLVKVVLENIDHDLYKDKCYASHNIHVPVGREKVTHSDIIWQGNSPFLCLSDAEIKRRISAARSGLM